MAPADPELPDNPRSRPAADDSISLFYEVDDDEQLTSADLADLDDPPADQGPTLILDPRAAQIVPSPRPAPHAPHAPPGSDTSRTPTRPVPPVPPAPPDPAAGAEDHAEVEFHDAVDPAAVDASLTFSARFDFDPPPAPPAPVSRAVWVVPWLISLIAHLCLIGGAVVVVWSVRQALSDDQVIANVSLSDDPGSTLQIQTPQPVKLPTPALVTPPPPAAPVLPAPADALGPAPDPMALPGADDPLPPPPTFEVPPPAASEFKTEFMGLGGNAQTVVFVVEADGSIISDYPQIVGELRRSLASLSEEQRFSVIVFDGQAAKEVPPAGLRPATPANKKHVGDWIADPANVQNMGSGDAVAALQLAFRRKPELVFLLSQNLYNPGRGQYETQRDEVLLALADAPANLKINTLEFNDLDPLAFDEQGNKVRPTLMEAIAQQTGGNYKLVLTNITP